jgi:hypothetical protein
MEESGQLLGVVAIISCVVSPLGGLLLDKCGGRPFAALIGMVAALISFTLLGFTSVPVIPCIILNGLSYAILPSALFPLVADTVPDEAFTQVYAITNAAVNTVLSITMLVAGELSESEVSISDAPPLAAAAKLVSSLELGSSSVMDTVRNEFKVDYTYVFVMFVIYTSFGTLATGWLSFKYLRVWLQRSPSVLSKPASSQSISGDISPVGPAGPDTRRRRTAASGDEGPRQNHGADLDRYRNSERETRATRLPSAGHVSYRIGSGIGIPKMRMGHVNRGPIGRSMLMRWAAAVFGDEEGGEGHHHEATSQI